MVGKELGAGAFGIVYEAVSIHMEFVCAMKIINKKNIDSIDPLYSLLLPDELAALEELDHPHIVRVFDLLEDEENVYIVSELMDMNLKELTDIMEEKNHKFTEAQIANIFYQLTLALNYIHASNKMHRDLKPENILVQIENDEEDNLHKTVCKITDFGLATVIKENKEHLPLGTPGFMAPEVLNLDYDSKADVWSLGVIAYMLLTGKKPFEGETKDELHENIRYHDPDYTGLDHYLDGGQYV